MLATTGRVLAADGHVAPAWYGHLPSLEDVVISPDGSHIGFVRTDDDERNLIIVRVEDSHAAKMRLGDTKLRGIEWLDEDNLLVTVSNTSAPPFGFTGPKSEWLQSVAINVSTAKMSPLNFRVPDQETLNVVAGETATRKIGNSTVLFVPGYYVTQQTLPGLFSYTLGGPRMKLIAKGSETNTHWLIDNAGLTAAQLTYFDHNQRWELKVRKSGQLATIARGSEAIEVPWLVGFLDAANTLIVGFIENGNPVWKPLSQDGAWGKPLANGAIFVDVIENRLTGQILGGSVDPDDSRYVFFDAELQAHWNAVLRAFPDEHVEMVSHTDDFTKILVRVFGAKDGYSYALFDWYTHQAQVLGQIYKGVQVLAVKRVTYAAADGMNIPGYLTLPAGGREKNLPLIVLPHGGPQASDKLGFDWWAQALAAQGYAVLQPNFRGSNLDYRFTAAGFGEWGRKMQTDLSDGVRYLVQRGIVDANRVCIVGASYGGYAALAGVTIDPGVYRCAVAVAGISDLKRMLNWENANAQRNDNLQQRYFDRFMGAKAPNDPALKAISPIEHVSSVTSPVLLIHGRDDTVVPYEQSDVMADALKHAGKEVQLVTLKREDHWLSRSATRQQMLETCVEFLQKNNPTD
jgi:dienelactone hydrolase